MANKYDNPPLPSASGFDEFVEDEGIDLRHYWRVVYRYKWGILGLVFAVGLFTTVWAYSLQPIYRSTATLLIGGNDTVTVSEQQQLKGRADMGTQYELLRSRKVADAVLEQLGPARASILARKDKDATSGFNWRDWIPRSWLSQDWLPESWQEPGPAGPRANRCVRSGQGLARLAEGWPAGRTRAGHLHGDGQF